MSLFDWFRGNTITSIDVANKILERKGSREFSWMKLMKITYLVYGWYLGTRHKKICADGAQAWRYGPIMPVLYEYLRTRYKNGSDIVKYPITKNKVEFTKEDISVIDRVIEVYGDWNAIELNANLTKYGSPWAQHCWDGFFAPIPNKTIEKYYSCLGERNKRRNMNV